MCRASISVLLMLLLSGLAAFAVSYSPLPATPQSGEMPCGGHHSCCVGPSPVNVPSLPSTLNLHRPPAVRRHDGPSATRPSFNLVMAYSVDALALPFNSAFSTVLRI